MRKQNPTQQDIARLVGVSQRAVAAVVGNGRTKYVVSRDTRERILKVAEEIGYRPHRHAQLFRGVKSGLIGYFKTLSMHEYRARQNLNVAARVQASGFHMISLDVIQEVVGLEQELEFLYDSQVEGLIISRFLPVMSELPIFDLFLRNGTPIVVLDRIPSDINCQLPCVYRDTQRGMGDLTRYLFNLGFASVGMVAMWHKNKEEVAYADERVQGYLDAVQERTEEPDVVWVQRAEQPTLLDRFFEAGRRGMRMLLERSTMPEAVCFQNDYMAYAALNECRRMGVNVPGDVAISGFDDQSLGHFSTPFLTSVAHPVETVAEKAVELLMDMINGRGNMSDPPAIAVPCTLKPRESTNSGWDLTGK